MFDAQAVKIDAPRKEKPLNVKTAGVLVTTDYYNRKSRGLLCLFSSPAAAKHILISKKSVAVISQDS